MQGMDRCPHDLLTLHRLSAARNLRNKLGSL